MTFAQILAAILGGYSSDGVRAVTDEMLTALRGMLTATGDAALTDGQLAEVNTALVALFDAAQAAHDLATMRAIASDATVDDDGTEITPAGVLQVVAAETAIRDAAAADAAAEAEALAALVHGEAAEADEPVTVEDEADAPAAEADVEVEQSAPAVAEERVLVNAAAAPAAPVGTRTPLASIGRPAGRQPVAQPRRSNARVTAGPELSNLSTGQDMTPGQVGQAFAERFDAIRSLAGRRGTAGRFPVARMLADFPTERQLVSDPAHNATLIAGAQVNEDGLSLTASGGLCAPVAIDYGQMRVDTDERPLRDALVSFQANRGGISFVEPPTLADINVSTAAEDANGSWDDDDTAVAAWSESLDTTPAGAVKPIQTIACGDTVTVNVDAIVARLGVGNFSRRTFPEQFDAWWGLAMSAHARKAENKTWEAMKATTRNLNVTSAQALGATRDLLAAIDLALAAFRHTHRMARRATLRVLLPDFVRDIIRTDLARQMAGDNTLAVADAQIDQFFAVRNASPTWLIDAGVTNVFAAQTAGALVDFPANIEIQIYPEGSWLFLDGGTLDLGVEIRDTTTNATNDAQAFIETFEQVAFVGVGARLVTLGVCPDGTAQGTVSVDFCGS